MVGHEQVRVVVVILVLLLWLATDSRRLGRRRGERWRRRLPHTLPVLEAHEASALSDVPVPGHGLQAHELQQTTDHLDRAETLALTENMQVVPPLAAHLVVLSGDDRPFALDQPIRLDGALSQHGAPGDVEPDPLEQPERLGKPLVCLH